jgi:hypothetical protein
MRKTRITNHVECWLSKVAVELCQTVGELRYVDSNELVWILYAIIKCRDAVKGQLGQVFVVDVLC